MEPIDLVFAFGLPPEKAIAYFRAKGYAIGWDWQDVWERAHARAFTVAKVMRQDILEDIRTAVDTALADGTTYQQFARELIPLLKSKGWWGLMEVEDGKTVQLGSPWRLRTIYEVNMQTAYMAGRYQEQMELAEERPYWMYVAVMDSRTRPDHARLNGAVFRSDDPFWQSHYPPNGWRCRCRVRTLSQVKLDKMGATVSTSEGKIFTEDRLVSKKTGEMKPVSVFSGSIGGQVVTMAPDVGWSYNPGRAYVEGTMP
ncbi:phage head morphogenesis protein [Desulfocastanea catecholica]